MIKLHKGLAYAIPPSLVFWLFIFMLLSGCANQQPYFKIGAGLKLDESKANWKRGGKVTSNSPISARLELGVETESMCYGISHHSQWLEGWTFNENGEYGKTELFVDYKLTW